MVSDDDLYVSARCRNAWLRFTCSCWAVHRQHHNSPFSSTVYSPHPLHTNFTWGGGGVKSDRQLEVVSKDFWHTIMSTVFVFCVEHRWICEIKHTMSSVPLGVNLTDRYAVYWIHVLVGTFCCDVVHLLCVPSHYWSSFPLDQLWFYLQGPAVVASSEGGMDIEKVAATNPDAILKEGIDIKTGMCSCTTWIPARRFSPLILAIVPFHCCLLPCNGAHFFTPLLPAPPPLRYCSSKGGIQEGLVGLGQWIEDGLVFFSICTDWGHYSCVCVRCEVFFQLRIPPWHSLLW